MTDASSPGPDQAKRLPLPLLRNCISWFNTDFRQWFLSPLEVTFPNRTLPHEVREVTSAITELMDFFGGLRAEADEADLYQSLVKQHGEGHAPFFKTALVKFRRHLAAETEALASKTFHRDLLAEITKDRSLLDRVVQGEWFAKLPASPLPRLRDFLSVQRIEELLAEDRLAPRQYDEKFGTLLAPTLFFSDFAYYRRRCEARGSSVAVAFLDIDGFKQFNTDYGETVVDTNLLPILMQAVEAHLYGHGQAYRLGGDEYLVLLPSVSERLATEFLDELRDKISRLTYPDIKQRTTVSVGMCVADADCQFTERELLEKANRAKKHAKDSGKNRISMYPNQLMRQEELQVVRPRP